MAPCSRATGLSDPISKRSSKTIISAGTSPSRKISSPRNGSKKGSIRRLRLRGGSPIASRWSIRSTIGSSTECSTNRKNGVPQSAAMTAEAARDPLAPYRGSTSRIGRAYADLHEHVTALAEAGLLQVISEPVNKDTEIHPLVRWQYRGG